MWRPAGVHSWAPALPYIYMNDITHALKDSTAILYADDTNLLFHDKDIRKLIENINSELLTVKSWFNANKLSLNISKTTFISFHNPQKVTPTNEMNIHIDNIPIHIFFFPFLTYPRLIARA